MSGSTFTRNPYEDLDFMTLPASTNTKIGSKDEGTKKKILKRLEQIQQRQSQLLGIDVHRVQQESIKLLAQSNSFDLQKPSVHRDSIYSNNNNHSTLRKTPFNTGTAWNFKNQYSSN